MTVEAFLSHKAEDANLAKQIKATLCTVFPKVDIFLSEEISKSADFRDEIRTRLERSKLFILLYTDPSADWSWCFFEAGSYLNVRPKRSNKKRPIYCLHQKDVHPPSPLANLQTIQGESSDIQLWLKDINIALGRQGGLPKEKIENASVQIEKAIKARVVLVETAIKPYIWIVPRWLDRQPNSSSTELRPAPLDKALVTIDNESATKLGFIEAPPKMELLPFLQTLDSDISAHSDKPYWIERFFSSLRIALSGRLELQEVAYFRHAGGNIYRPVVASVSKSKDGANYKLKVIFAHAFSPPITDRPTHIQRLADGIRLGVRTRIEIIDGFSGRLSKLHAQMIESTSEMDLITRTSPVGRRLVEALEAITEEGQANGLRPDDPAPFLFSDPSEQEEYERIRAQAAAIWEKLKDVAQAEDKDKSGNYSETESLIIELKVLNERYLKIALPRLNALLAT